MRMLRISLCLVAVLTLGGAAAPGAVAQAPAPVFPPNAKPLGQSYEQWAADWWQWAAETEASQNPLADTTGEFCAVNQDAKVWFLAGSLGGAVDRTCTVPTGTPLLFPVLNAFACNDPGGMVGEQALRDSISYIGDATDLMVTIDGVAVPNVSRYFEESAVFSLTLPEDNIFGAPAGLYDPCVDAGYYVAVRPLPPGEHTIQFSGSVLQPQPPPTPPTLFSVDVTYIITVAPGKAAR
jgi:hypothetical protein